MNFAELVLLAKTDSLRRGKEDLVDLRNEGERTEKAVTGSMGKVSSGFSSAAKAAGALAAAVGVGSALNKAINDARGFSRGLAEVSTLIEGTPAQMDALAKSSKALAASFGTTAQSQVEAFYQAISAGAGSVEEAAAVLDAANKFAVGGVTDVTTGVDALTTAMNAYAATNLTAAEASDALFVGIKGGKTTADELAASLGNIVPLASAAGISFDEVVAATAALTTQGLGTSEAVTGLRQTISGIIKPTSEAAKEAERLGIAFSADALADQGLAAFLEDVIAKTGGSQESLAQLFGSVEALNTVLSMAGGGGAAFNDILADMEVKAGATAEAYGKMADSADNRLSVATAQMSVALLEIGEAVLPMLVPAVQAVAEAVVTLSGNMSEMGPVLAAAGLAFGAVAAPITAIGVAMGTAAILVVNNWDEIKKAFSSAEEFRAALDKIVEYVAALGGRLVDALKEAGKVALQAALLIGVEIINGISAGIDRKFQELKDKITSLGVYLPEWLKDMLGIASPSKVFAEIGEWTVEGLMVGMDDREVELRARAETLGATMGDGIKDGLDPVLSTIFDGLARGDLGGIGSSILRLGQQSFSTLLHDSFAVGGGGLSNVWQSITGSFSGLASTYRSAGGGLGGIGAAVSSLLPGIGAISSIAGIVQSFIGTTEKLTNALEGTLGIGGLLRGSEYDIKKTTNIFGSKTEKNAEEIFGSWAKYIAQDLDQEFRDTMGNAIDLVRSLGLEVDEAFTFDFDVKFDESLPHEQLMERLRAELDKAEDAFYRSALAAAGLAREGETGAQTLQALNAAISVANTSLSALGFAVFDLSAVGAGAAREFADMFGGVDALAQGVGAYVSAFYDQADQLGVVTQRVSDMLSGLNVDNFNTALDSRENFRALTDWAGSNAANDPAQAAMFAALINVAPLADEMFKLRDALAETGDTAGETTDTVTGLIDVQREEQSLLAQLYRLQGDTAAIRQMELDAIAPVNRHILERIHALEDEQAAAQLAEAAARALADAQAAIASEAEGLMSQYERLMGDQEAIRAREFAGVDEANHWILEMIHAREDEVAAMEAAEQAAAELEAALEAEAAKAREIADERAGLERRILELLGDTTALRQLEIDAVDAANQHLVVRIHNILDEQAAAEAATQAAEEAARALEAERQAQEDLAAAARAAAQAIADEAYALETQWLQAIGDVAALRARELELLDPSNRAMQLKIWAYLDEQAALEEIAEAARVAEQALLDAAEAERQRVAAIADERYRLETRLYELQGNTALLRERELALLDPSNRELQKLIWSLEDAAAAAGDATDGVTDLSDVLSELRSEMRDALSLVESLISTEIDAIQSAAQARIDALQSEIDMARDMADTARDTLQGAFDVVRASIDADRTMLVAGYTAAIEALDNRMEAATANVDRLRGVFDLLDGALSSRLLGGTVREGARYMQAQSYIRGLTGLPANTDALEGALQALSGDGSRFYANSTDFEFDFLRTNAALSNLRGQAGGELSDAERQVAAIEGARAAREAQHERELARLDDQLATAQAIYDEALGQTINLMDVGDGIDGLRNAADQYTSLADQLVAIEATAGVEIAAISAATDAQVGLLEDQLAEARRAVEIAEGTYNSITTIQEAIDHLNQTIAAFSEANSEVNQQYVSDTTQPIIDIPSEVADLRSENSEENARILEQNRQLTEEVRQLRDDVNQLLKSLVKNSSEVNTNIKRWEAIGLPPERTT